MPSQNPNASKFFETGWQKAQEAIQKTQQITRNIYIADHFARLEFAGDTLANIFMPPFAHVIVENISAPALTVRLWETETTAVMMPPPPWSADAFSDDGYIRGYNDASYSTYYDSGAGIFSMLEYQTQRAIFWTRSLEHVPPWERAAPLIKLFSSWLNTFNLKILHAAAIGKNDQGVLLIGKGGSGKSTTALACLNAAWDYVSDDYCAVTLAPEPRAFTLYNSGKLKDDSFKKLPNYQQAFSGRTHQDKNLFFVQRLYAHNIQSSLAIKAILIPQVKHAPQSTLVRASGAQALRALAPSVLFQLRENQTQNFNWMASLTRQLPCYYLNLSEDLNALPNVIAQVFE